MRELSFEQKKHSSSICIRFWHMNKFVFSMTVRFTPTFYINMGQGPFWIDMARTFCVRWLNQLSAHFRFTLPTFIFLKGKVIDWSGPSVTNPPDSVLQFLPPGSPQCSCNLIISILAGSLYHFGQFTETPPLRTTLCRFDTVRRSPAKLAVKFATTKTFSFLWKMSKDSLLASLDTGYF